MSETEKEARERREKAGHDAAYGMAHLAFEPDPLDETKTRPKRVDYEGLIFFFRLGAEYERDQIEPTKRETILNLHGQISAQKVIAGKLDPLPRPGESILVGDIPLDVVDVTHVLDTGNLVLDVEPVIEADRSADRLEAVGFTVRERVPKERT